MPLCLGNVVNVLSDSQCRQAQGMGLCGEASWQIMCNFTCSGCTHPALTTTALSPIDPRLTTTTTTAEPSTTVQLCNGIADPELCTRVLRAGMCGGSESIQALCPVMCGACTSVGQMTMSPSSAPSRLILGWDETSLLDERSIPQGDSDGDGNISTITMVMIVALAVLFALLGTMQLKLYSIATAAGPANTSTKQVFSHEELAKALQASGMSKWQGTGQWRGNGPNRQMGTSFSSEAASYITAHPGPPQDDDDADDELVEPYAQSHSSDVVQERMLERMQERMESRISSRAKTYESIKLNDDESDIEYEMAAPKSRLGTAKVSYSTCDEPDVSRQLEARSQMISALTDARDTAKTVLEVDVLNMIMDTGTADPNEFYDNFNDNQSLKRQPGPQGGQALMEVYATATVYADSTYEIASPTRGGLHDGAGGAPKSRGWRRGTSEMIYEVASPVTSPNAGKSSGTRQGESTEETLYQVASPIMSPVLSPLNGGTMRAKMQDLLSRKEGPSETVTSPVLSPLGGTATTAKEYLACSESSAMAETSGAESQSDDDDLYPVSVHSSSSYPGGKVVLSPNALHDEMYGH